jgi:uncharacterized glyoxalase superfamily protein PhnB
VQRAAPQFIAVVRPFRQQYVCLQRVRVPGRPQLAEKRILGGTQSLQDNFLLFGEFSRIVLSMTNAQATYETLRDRGVTFSEPPTAQPWGMIQALFEDQDGNGYVLVGA